MAYTKRIGGRVYRNTFTRYTKAAVAEFRAKYGRARGVRGRDGKKRIYISGKA